MLLAFDDLPEATSWQLLGLLVTNLALIVCITKWQANKKRAVVRSGIIATVAALVLAGFKFITITFILGIVLFLTTAIAISTAGTFAVALTVAVIGVFASAFAIVVDRAKAGIIPLILIIVFTFAIAFASELLLLESLNALPIGPLKLLSAKSEVLNSDLEFHLSAFAVLFLVLPWINAALDWLSVSASRAAFYLLHRDLSAENREDRTYGKAFAHLVVDLVLALAFKLMVLLMLYIYAQLYGEFGVSFSVDTVKAYWAVLNPLDSVPFDRAKLWDSSDHKFITLMISTTLLPTLLHFGWVLLYVLCRSLWTLLRLLFAFAVSEAATFAATISVLITVAALTALTMAIDPSDDDKGKEGNTTNATQTSELLIPPPTHLPI